jgi:hypothetical protein
MGEPTLGGWHVAPFCVSVGFLLHRHRATVTAAVAAAAVDDADVNRRRKIR